MASVKLKVNKELLDYKFEGYKLSLDPIPILQQTVPDGGILSPAQNSEDFGFLQTRFSCSHNSLFLDPWCEQSVFYITSKFNVIWTALGEDGLLTLPQSVWTIPTQEKSDITVCFPDADWVLLCDGRSQIHVLYTESRAAGQPWTVSHTIELESPSLYYLLHAAHKTTPSGVQLDFVLASVQNKSKLPSDVDVPENCTFVCLLEWRSVVSSQNDQVWSTKSTRRLWGRTYPEYVAIDNAGDAICVLSSREYKFYYDSEIPVVKNGHGESSETLECTFSQTDEDICLSFCLPPGTLKSEIAIESSAMRVQVAVRGRVLFEKELPRTVNTSTWTFEKDKLEVTLSKNQVGETWPDITQKGDSVEEINMSSPNEENIPFNLAQLESCDIEEEQFVFQRISGKEHTDMQKVHLSGWLFSCSIKADALPALCLRHDVDGLLWQPKQVLGSDLEVIHTATFHALGYIMAGRRDKTYVSCDTHFRYAVMTDSGRHLYLYRRPETLSDSLQLRNRKTGESVSHVAKQYVVSLENCDRLLGMRVAPHAVFALAKETLYVAKLS